MRPMPSRIVFVSALACLLAWQASARSESTAARPPGTALEQVPATSDEDDAPAAEAEEPALASDPARLAELSHLARALRSARRSDPPLREALVQTLSSHGAAAIEPTLDLLVAQRVPKTAPEEGRQVLSRPQRDLLLAALGRQEARAVRTVVEGRLARARTLLEWRVGLWALAAAADGGTTSELLRDWRERGAPALKHDDWSLAFSLVLSRDERGFSDAARFWPDALPEQQRGLVEAAGDLGQPQGLELILSVLDASRDDLGVIAAGQVLRIGRSYDTQVNRALGARLREWCDPARPALCQTVVQALGELRDRESLPRFIELLDSGDDGLRGAALSALRRASGTALKSTRDTWARWLAAQESALAVAPRRAVPRLAARELDTVLDGLRELRTLRIDREEVVGWIAPVLQRSEPGLRIVACEVLGEIDDRSAAPLLLFACDDRDKRVAAAARAALRTIVGHDLPVELGELQTALAVVGCRD